MLITWSPHLLKPNNLICCHAHCGGSELGIGYTREVLQKYFNLSLILYCYVLAQQLQEPITDSAQSK
jgi:hypothetical protein